MNTLEEIGQLIEGTVTIPTVPTTLAEINRIINDPEGSAEEASKVVATDPAIATKVLRLANSSLYSLRVPVSDIRHAVSILGLRILRNLVVQATILEHFKSTKPEKGQFDPTWLWDHSNKAACAARLIVAALPGVFEADTEEAYTGGLLHDVGKILLLENDKARFLQAAKDSLAKNIPMHRLEEEVFGFTHADVGALLAHRWQLSATLAEMIQHHHSPDDSPHSLSSLLHCANGIAHAVASGNGGYTGHEVSEDYLQSLGIEEAKMEEILKDVGGAEFMG